MLPTIFFFAILSLPRMLARMAPNLHHIPRPDKRDIATKVLDLLKARAAAGPAEPALDAYIPELDDVEQALALHVEGSATAQGQRAARLVRLEFADDNVDRWYRHTENFLDAVALMRTGEHAKAVRFIHTAAFPAGLAYIDTAIADENRQCRDAITILQLPEHQPTLAAIEFPLIWLTRWSAALDESDAALKDIHESRTTRQSHIQGGQDAEDAWVETFVRLRKYIGSRAKKSDTARIQEGEVLLAPLLDTLKKMGALAASRATRRHNETAAGTPPSTTP